MVLISRHGRQSLLHADWFAYNAARGDVIHTAPTRCTYACWEAQMWWYEVRPGRLSHCLPTASGDSGITSLWYCVTMPYDTQCQCLTCAQNRTSSSLFYRT